MAEEAKAVDAAPAVDTKKKKGGEDKQVGKFTHGDHMVHVLL